MYRLRINSEQVELDQKTKIRLNKVIVDINDFSKRGINFTNALTLPFTAKNDRLTGYPSRLASNNLAFEANQRYELLDEFGIISRGDVVIKSFDDKKGIKIQLAEGYGFWSQAGKKLLNDLVNHGDDFVFNTTNMDGFKSKGSSVFVTALHSATGDTTDTALTTYDYTRPTYYFRTVLEKIVAELGYTLDFGDTLQATELDYIGCLSNTKDFFVSDFKYRLQDDTVLGTIDIGAGTSIFTKFGNVSLISGTTLTNTLYKTSYVIKGAVNALESTYVSFIVNGQPQQVLIPKGQSFINFKTDEVEIGGTVTMTAQESVTFEDVYIYSAISEGDIFEISGTIDISDYLVLSDYNLPQHTYKDFIKNLFKMLFLSAEIDESIKTVTLRYMADQISNNNAIDLSRLASRYVEIKSGSVYGQLNSMAYANDEDVGVNLGALFFSVENKNAKETKEFIKVSEYSSSRELTDAASNTFITASIYDVVENKRVSVADRILYLESTGTFGINAVFSPVSWSRLHSNHYFSFIDATKRERTGVLSAKLTNLQYREIQERPVIYLEDFKSHFFVSEISDFDNKNLCKLIVLKYA